MVLWGGGVEEIYLTVLWVGVRDMGVRDIPYGFMCGCKRYTLFYMVYLYQEGWKIFFYGWM